MDVLAPFTLSDYWYARGGSVVRTSIFYIKIFTTSLDGIFFDPFICICLNVLFCFKFVRLLR